MVINMNAINMSHNTGTTLLKSNSKCMIFLHTERHKITHLYPPAWYAGLHALHLQKMHIGMVNGLVGGVYNLMKFQDALRIMSRAITRIMQAQ